MTATRATTSPAVEFAARVAAAVVLGVVHLRSGRRAGGRPTRHGPARLGAITLISVAGPALAVRDVSRAQPVRLVAPPSWSARVLLAAWLLAGVVVEEVIWRAPLLRRRSTPYRAALTAVSITGFVAAHLRRDGLASARVHVPNTLGWTAAAMLDGRLRTAAVSHLVYNFVAVGLRADTTGPQVER